MGKGIDLGRIVKNSLDDTGPALRPLGDIPRKMKGKQRRNRDGTDEVDRFDDKPDVPTKPKTSSPNDAGGSGTPGDGVPEKRRGVDRGDGRDDYGHFVGSENRPWVDKEQIGLDEVADDLGVNVRSDKVAARIDGVRRPDADADQIRYFDGLYQNRDGTYTGVEIKSGGAGRDAAQREFDATVSPGRPARATLDGELISIVRVILKEVP